MKDCFNKEELKQLIKNVNDSLKIDLSGKQINSLHNNTFNGLTLLRELDLGGNQISSINEKTFNGLTNLHWLDLENNQIQNKEQIKKKLQSFLKNCTIII